MFSSRMKYVQKRVYIYPPPPVGDDFGPPGGPPPPADAEYAAPPTPPSPAGGDFAPPPPGGDFAPLSGPPPPAGAAPDVSIVIVLTWCAVIPLLQNRFYMVSIQRRPPTARRQCTPPLCGSGF